MKRIRVTLELVVNEQATTNYGIADNELLRGIAVKDNYDADGALVTTDIFGINPTSDILLGECRLVSKDILPGPVIADDKQYVRDAIREDIVINGEESYGLTKEDIKALTEEQHPAVEALTGEVYPEVEDGDGEQLYKAISNVMAKFIGVAPGVGCEDIRTYGT